MTIKDKIKKIELYGKKFIKIYIIEDKNVLLNQWYEGLLFFLEKSFNRGRRDEISHEFFKRTKIALGNYKLKNNIHNFSPGILEKELIRQRVNNHIDRRMVIETIKYLLKIHKNNLIKHTIKSIKMNNIKDHFIELTNIYGIGDKLASLYLRDIVFLYKLDNFINSDEFEYYQPIDTWVKQIATKLKIINENEKRLEIIKRKIINQCKKTNVSPLFFNAGAWLVGAQPLTILLDEI